MKNPNIDLLHLERLINELVKDKPDQEAVKKMMANQGIPYSNDPLTQLGTVLSLMDCSSGARKANKKQTKRENEL